MSAGLTRVVLLRFCEEVGRGRDVAYGLPTGSELRGVNPAALTLTISGSLW